MNALSVLLRESLLKSPPTFLLLRHHSSLHMTVRHGVPEEKILNCALAPSIDWLEAFF